MNRRARFRPSLHLALGLAVALLIGAAPPATPANAGVAPAALDNSRVPAATTVPASLDDPNDLEAFMDGLITAQLSGLHIPAAVVAVVKDSELFFAKGYGYADLDTLEPADADATLFRVGSVSKLFTWTAVMQLVESGQLDLNADVNTYLDFEIPATYPQPITLQHLMTHTPGFEDKGLGLFATSPDDVVPLGRYLADDIPARVYPPGEISAYSNYGAALAGYIVERVSGIPFDRYVEERILHPLGMVHSTLRQSDLPAALVDDMAMGYSYANGAFKPEAPVYTSVYPAGSLVSTATDIARFMIAHLQNGQYGEARILDEATAKEMHRQQYANDPGVSGMALGFMESSVNNLRLIGHGGDIGPFHTALSLLPEQDVGLFVSYNSTGASATAAVDARDDLLQAFLDRYYPAERAPLPQPPADFAARAGRFAGAYVPSRTNYTTPEKVSTLFMPMTVRPTPHGTLLASYGPIQMQFVETGLLAFRSLEDHTSAVFQEDAGGQIKYLFFDNMPVQGFIKLPWHASPTFHLPLLIVCLFLFLAGLIAWPIQLWTQRRRARAALPRAARGVGIAVAALNLIFAIGTVLLFMSVMASPTGIPAAMPAVMTIPVVTAVLALGMLAFTLLAWAKRFWRAGGRLFYTLVTLAALAFVWSVHVWNLWVIAV